MAADDGAEAEASALAQGAQFFQKYLWLVLFLVGTLGSEVYNKQTTIAAPAYPMALVMLLGFLGILIYPLITAAAFFSGRISKDRICGPGPDGVLTWWRPPTVWWKPAIIGGLFVLHDMLQKVGGRGAVPGVLVLILAKLTIPFSMVFSVAMLRLRYLLTHYVALVFLLVGVVASVAGQFGDATWGSPAAAAFKTFIIACGVVPLALAFVYLERWLKGTDSHVFTVAFWAWTCLWMAPFTILLVPVGALLAGQSFGHMWTNLTDGMRCYVLGAEVSYVPAGQEPPNCAKAGLLWKVSVFFTLLSNLAMPLCTKHGSATVLWVVRALALPLAGMLFASHAVMGDNARPGTAPTWFGLVLVTVGVFLFNARDPEKLDRVEAEESLDGSLSMHPVDGAARA